MQDIRYAVRMLLKNPVFTAVAVLTLALGIGANTAIFTIVNAVLLRPLPYPDSSRVVFLERTFRQGSSISVSLPKCDYWRRNTRSFEAVASADFMGGGYNLAGDEPERLKGVRVNADFFKVLGVSPALGRGFVAADDRPNTSKTVVISDGLWQRRFGGDRAVLGRTLTVNNEPATVIGVMPPSFKPFPEADIWLPLQPVVSYTDKANYLMCVARISDNSDFDKALADIRGVSGQFRKEYPDLMSDAESARITTMQDELLGDVRPALLVLMGAVAAVLLIACANVANLLLARAAGRTREIAIRMSVGASRWRLMRQLLIESVLMSLTGGMIGLVLGAWGVKLLGAVAPTELPLVEPSLDFRVLAFTLGVSVLTGILFGLIPALHASSPKLSETLKEGSGRATVGLRRSRTRALLVAGEIAIALMVVICAGLITQTLMRLRSVNPGFDSRGVVTMQMSLSGPRFETTQQLDTFYRQVLQRIEAVPGVQAAALTVNLPLEQGPDLPFQIEGERDLPNHDAQWRHVTPNYFKALGIKLKRGRTFTDNEAPNSAPVIIVNESFARQYFAKQDPVGRQITIGRIMGPALVDQTRQIVGIVADVKEFSLERDAPATMYIPSAQVQGVLTGMLNKVLPSVWIVRTAGDPMRLVQAIRNEIRAVDRTTPVANIRTMDQVMRTSIARQNFSMVLFASFAVLALVLAAVGIYGVMAYSVTQRKHELGIRIALGAKRADMLGLVVGQGMVLAGAGIVVGLVAAFFATRLLASLLFGVTATHPPTFAGVALLIAIVALVASYIPARRATAVDPIIALRYE